jgi:dihydrofolate synthase / folylpolyglutamate synthase
VTYSNAIRFLYSLRWFGAKLGLDNSFKLAALAGDPQKRLRFIHVAGTNGKGSTCAMLESIYRAAGLRVGLFTSPHLVAFGERIQVNRHVIFARDIGRLAGEMKGLLEKGWGESASQVNAGEPAAEDEAAGPAGEHATDGHPTFFEVVTIMALRYFAEQKCDLVIWETGLGGRLDATNIVTPLTSVITNIQYDHQNWLGETLSSIAAEKAGIIKPGIPVITAAEGDEALPVIAEAARRQNAPLTTLSPAETHCPPLDTLQLPLLGQHQRMNAAVAVATVRALASQIPVSDDVIRIGLSHVHWAGRLQLVTRPNGQKVLLDGAHNIGGAGILAASVNEYFPSVKLTLVLGILRDKDWPGMCEILAPLAERIFLVPVPSERSATPQELAVACRGANPRARVTECASLRDALAATIEDAFLTVAGSLYLVGEAMELLHLSPAKAADERRLNEWSGIAASAEATTSSRR